jgi:hypothetical protein
MEEPVWFGKVVGCLNSASIERKKEQDEQDGSRNTSAHDMILRYPVAEGDACF